MTRRLAIVYILINALFVTACSSPEPPGPPPPPAASGENRLASLGVSEGTLSPAFDAETLTYTVLVPHSVESLTVTASALDSGASVSGPASYPLEVGQTLVTVIVTAANGATRTYTLNLTRAAADASNNPALASLSLAEGTLAPAFAAETLAYTATVASDVSALTVTAAAEESGAQVHVAGATGLQAGENEVTVTVTAPDGVTTRVYTVTVTRESPPEASNNPALASLTLSAGTLTPAFAPGTVNYTATVANEVSALTLEASAAETGAQVAGTGVQVLSLGSNALTVTVTAPDGVTTRVYTVTVTRAAAAASGDATLSSLGLSAGTLSPAFAPGTLIYTASVAHGVSSVTVTAVAAEAEAEIAGAGSTALSVGENEISLTVTAPDGQTQITYVITVTRAESNDTRLASLSLSAGTLSPSFDPAVTAYGLSAALANSVSLLTIEASALDPQAEVSGTGTFALSEGTNEFVITVTAADGVTTGQTTLTVVRQARTQAPAFNPVNGSAVLAGTTVQITSATPGASIRYTLGDGSQANPTTTSGTLYNDASRPALSAGNTVLKALAYKSGESPSAVVTATYSLLSANADLSALSLSSGAINPAFDPAVTSYTATVPNATSSITLSATAAAAGAGLSGTGVQALSVGPNALAVTVTAPAGNQKTYTVTVTRASPSASTNADLASLSVTGRTLSPAYSAGTTSYTLTEVLPYTVETVTLNATAADGTATLLGTGTKTLVDGDNVFTITVTAEAGNTKTYTVTISRDVAPTGGALVEVTLQEPGDPPLTWTLGGIVSGTQQDNNLTIAWGTPFTASVAGDGILANLEWRIDGATVHSGNNLSLDPATRPAGPFFLNLWFDLDGQPYSQSLRLTVQN